MSARGGCRPTTSQSTNNINNRNIKRPQACRRETSRSSYRPSQRITPRGTRNKRASNRICHTDPRSDQRGARIRYVSSEWRGNVSMKEQQSRSLETNEYSISCFRFHRTVVTGYQRKIMTGVERETAQGCVALHCQRKGEILHVENDPVPLHRQLLSQPICRSSLRLRREQDGPALASLIARTGAGARGEQHRPDGRISDQSPRSLGNPGRRSLHALSCPGERR